MTIPHKFIRLTFISLLIILGAYSSALGIQTEAAKQPEVSDNLHSATPAGSPVEPCSLKDVGCTGEPEKVPQIKASSGKQGTQKASGDTLTLKTTAFSSVECKTTWCRANAGKPRGQKVALNAKFGKAKAVYVPKFGKTYDVIGTTDYLTDLDVWFGDDQAGALRHGTQWLDVKILR